VLRQTTINRLHAHETFYHVTDDLHLSPEQEQHMSYSRQDEATKSKQASEHHAGIRIPKHATKLIGTTFLNKRKPVSQIELGSSFTLGSDGLAYQS